MRNKSFTLIELLVVIVIIGILAGVIMISTSSSIDKANIAKGKVFDESVKNNLMVNLVSEWDFDDASHPYYDSWGDNNGSCTNCPTYTSSNECIRGGCAYFEVDNTYILLSRSFTLINNNSTLSFWFKKTNDLDVAIFTRYNYCCYSYLQIRANGAMEGEVDTNEIYLPGYNTLANDKKWHNYVLVSGNGTSNLYIDGVSESDKAVWGGSMTLNSIGTVSGTAYTKYLKGYMDEIKFYNSALSEAQIKNNYLANLKFMFASKKLSREEYNEKVNNLSYEK